MKTTMLITIIASVLSISLYAQHTENADEVESIEEFNNLYRYQDYYIAGQPSLDELKWLKSKGVTRVINLRSEGENEDFTSSSFDEKAIVEELGMEYYMVPVSGRSGYTLENVKTLGEMINNDENVLIHCAGAGRATNFFMAYLVQFKGYTLDEAVDVGQDMTYYLPLEDLLEIEITMQAR